MRSLALLLVTLGLSGCGIVYHLPTRQGNLIEQKKFDEIQLGQTRAQVRYVLGTPISTSVFAPDRWTYYGYYKDPRGHVASRTVQLYFDGDKLARAEGLHLGEPGSKAVEGEDVESVVRDQKNKKPQEAEPGSPGGPPPSAGG